MASASTKMSKNLREATIRAKSLYRKTMRSVPQVCAAYELECSPAELKEVLRRKFQKHLNVKDSSLIDVLCFKGEQELQETMMMWKTKAHVEKYANEVPRAQGDFVSSFYKGYEVEEWSVGATALKA